MELFKIFGRIALNGVDDVNHDLNNTTSNAEGSSSRMVSAFKKIGTAVATYFAVDKIVSFGKACVSAAAEVAAEEAAFTQIMGDYSDEAQKKIDEIADATGIANTRMTPYMTSMSAKFKGLGYGVEDATDLAARGLTIAADASAFWDKSMDDSMGALNSFINGSYEAGESIGLFANDTQMAAYAVEKGIVKNTKNWASLDEATKQATRIEYAENMMALSGATGQAAKESGAYANVQANLAEAWRQFQTVIGEPLLNNIVLPAMQKLNEILPIAGEYVSDLIDWVGGAWTKFKEWGTYLYDTFSPVFAALRDLWDTVKTKISDLIQPITDWITSGQAAKDTTNFLKDAIEAVAGALENVITWINDFIIWLDSGSTGAEAFKAVVIGIAAAIGTYQLMMGVATIASNAMTFAMGLAKAAMAALNFVMSMNPIALVVLAITGLVAAFIYLWNNCEEFREFWINLWETIKQWCSEAWESIKKWFSEAWEWCVGVWEGASEWFNGLWEGVQSVTSSVWESIKTAISNVWNGIKIGVSSAINAVRNTVTNVFNAVKNKVSSIWNGIKTTISNVWTGIKSGVSTAINGVKNTVSNVFNTVKSNATRIWNGIKEAISKPIEAAKEKVSDVIDKIKGFFDFEFKWPNIPMPHFGISPEGWEIGDLLKGSIPKLGIEWYAKAMNNAMILDKPSIFGYNAETGELLGGGENGSEVVTGTGTLMNMIGSAVDSRMSAYTERMISVLTALMEAVTGGNQEIVQALLSGQKIVINNREFARAVREYA